MLVILKSPYSAELKEICELPDRSTQFLIFKVKNEVACYAYSQTVTCLLMKSVRAMPTLKTLWGAASSTSAERVRRLMKGYSPVPPG